MIAIECTAPDTIRFERILDAPVETVWRYLVEPELRALWFAGGATDPREGGAIDLIFDHDNLSADDVLYPAAYAAYKGATVHERILRFDPPRVFAFTFEGDGVASFELFPEGGRTRLVLTHSGIAKRENFAGFGGGWHSHLAVLQALFRGERIGDFWALHAQSEAAVKAALGG